ncbi:MAG: hypothetical protein HC912_13160 [Saprospiraceae bacterium]|nr:hypothetical protein [Saprospiraceae bacterium]
MEEKMIEFTGKTILERVWVAHNQLYGGSKLIGIPWNFPKAETIEIKDPKKPEEFNKFVALPDVSVIENSFAHAWNVLQTENNKDDKATYPEYHLIYSYLLESTHLVQIFERIILKLLNSEELGNLKNEKAMYWVQNTEQLFCNEFHTLYFRSLISRLRPNFNETINNLYYRFFGFAVVPPSGMNAMPNFYKLI